MPWRNPRKLNQLFLLLISAMYSRLFLQQPLLVNRKDAASKKRFIYQEPTKLCSKTEWQNLRKSVSLHQQTLQLSNYVIFRADGGKQLNTSDSSQILVLLSLSQTELTYFSQSTTIPLTKGCKLQTHSLWTSFSQVPFNLTSETRKVRNILCCFEMFAIHHYLLEICYPFGKWRNNFVTRRSLEMVNRRISKLQKAIESTSMKLVVNICWRPMLYRYLIRSYGIDASCMRVLLPSSTCSSQLLHSPPSMM